MHLSSTGLLNHPVRYPIQQESPRRKRPQFSIRRNLSVRWFALNGRLVIPTARIITLEQQNTSCAHPQCRDVALSELTSVGLYVALPKLHREAKSMRFRSVAAISILLISAACFAPSAPAQYLGAGESKAKTQTVHYRASIDTVKYVY